MTSKAKRDCLSLPKKSNWIPPAPAVHCIHEGTAQKRWRFSTSAIKDPSRYSGKSLISTFHATSSWASCVTNPTQNWEAVQDSRQLLMDPTESSLWFRVKVDKISVVVTLNGWHLPSRLLYLCICHGEVQGLQARSPYVTASYLQNFTSIWKQKETK